MLRNEGVSRWLSLFYRGGTKPELVKWDTTDWKGVLQQKDNPNEVSCIRVQCIHQVSIRPAMTAVWVKEDKVYLGISWNHWQNGESLGKKGKLEAGG